MRNEAEIRKAMQARFPGVPVESVAKTPFPGIFEVVVGGRILYTDEKASFVFIGNLLDTRGARRARPHRGAHRAAHRRRRLKQVDAISRSSGCAATASA